MAASQNYRCPKCGDTFAATAEIPAAAGCPCCRGTAFGDWYLKVRGEIIGPVPFETLREQVDASAVQVRRAGEDWRPAAEIQPPSAVPSGDPPEPRFEIEEEPTSAGRQFVLPVISVVAAILLLAGGWVYHHVTLARAIEGSESAERDGIPRDRTDAQRPRAARAAATGSLQELQERIAAEKFRRDLLVDVAARQERKLTAQMQQLRAAMPRSRRFRRFGRGFDPPDEPADKSLLTDFRRGLADAWAKTMAHRQDAAAEQGFYAAEYRRLTGAALVQPLQAADLAWLKKNGVRYHTQYNAFYTSAHRELMLYMEFATADEISKFASRTGLSFPSGTALPVDFAAALAKRSR